MSSSRVSLLQMPEDPMEHILDYLDFPSILTLRKVCHDLRNFVDVTKPAFRLTEIFVDLKHDSIISYLKFHRPPSSIYIKYVENGTRCLVKNHRAEKEFEETIDEDFVTVFCKDFEIILRHQKTVLEEFEIQFNYSDHPINLMIMKSVNKPLISMDKPLQVKLLEMKVKNHNEILKILPYIDAKTLEHINISDPLGTKDLNFDEIRQLEQWKQADGLTIKTFLLPYLCPNLKHFSRVDLTTQMVSTEELFSLKEMFLSSSTLTIMKFYYNSYISYITKERLIKSFGQPFLDTNQNENWFFSISNTNQLLRIHHQTGYMVFNRIERSGVPQNAIIQN